MFEINYIIIDSKDKHEPQCCFKSHAKLNFWWLGKANVKLE